MRIKRNPMDVMRAFEEEPKPLDFVLPGLLAGTVGAIVSPGGVGKSMLALELAVLVATGHDISGFGGGVERPTGKVGFLAGEDKKTEIIRRLHNIGKYLEGDTRDLLLIEDLQVFSLQGTHPIDIDDPEWLATIEDVATDKRMLVIDPLRKFCAYKDEPNNNQIVRVIREFEDVARRKQCAIVLLHTSSVTDALSNLVRWQMSLAGCSWAEAKKLKITESARAHYVRAGVSKQNYGPPMPDVWLRRSDGGVLLPAAISATPAH